MPHGVPTVDEITPAAGLPMLVSGRSNWGWLKIVDKAAAARHAQHTDSFVFLSSPLKAVPQSETHKSMRQMYPACGLLLATPGGEMPASQ